MDGSYHLADHNADQEWIAVVLLEGFSALSLGSITEPFARFREMAPDQPVDVRIVGSLPSSAKSASGVEVVCEMYGRDLLDKLFGLDAPKAIFFCGPTCTEPKEASETLAIARKAQRARVPCYGIGSIVLWLADAGLLKNQQATTHWRILAPFKETCSDIETCNALFVSDYRGGSCAGELATLDMVVDFIAAHSPNLAGDICNQLLISQLRKGNSLQPGSQQDRLNHMPKELSLAAQFMADEIENAPRICEVAFCCGVSMRKLERQFQEHLAVSPMQYMISLKVERAIELIQQTNLPLGEVALAAGLKTASTMAKKVRQTFGMTPSEMRKQRREKT